MSRDPKYVLCPYCGHVQTHPTDRCRACGGFFDPLSVKVTHQMMGPWYIRDRHMPFRPGANYDVMLKQIERGRIKPNTIVRGPTTRQLWSLARHVPGMAHKLGYCHACGKDGVDSQDDNCAGCGAVFPTPLDSDSLGLGPKAVAYGQARSSLEFVQDESAMVDGEQVTVHQPGRDMVPEINEPARGVVTEPARRASATFLPPAGPPTPTPPTSRDDALNWLTSPEEQDADDLLRSDAVLSAQAQQRSAAKWIILLIVVINLLAIGAVILILLMHRDGIRDEPVIGADQAPRHVETDLAIAHAADGTARST